MSIDASPTFKIVLSGRFWGWQGEFDMQMSTAYGWEGRTYETVPVPVREEHREKGETEIICNNGNC
jgi:hypothetical protein